MLALVLALGPPLQRDGYRLRPPQGFRMSRTALFRGTQVGAVSVAPAVEATFSALLIDEDTEGSAAMIVSTIGGPLPQALSNRDELAGAVARHFREALGLDFSVERSLAVVGGRVEVVGAVRADGQLRRVLVVVVPGTSHHAIVIASVPVERWAEQEPQLRASIDTLVLDAGLAAEPHPLVLLGFTAGVGALLVWSLWLRRRRRTQEGS
jgi:hypothetical protein